VADFDQFANADILYARISKLKAYPTMVSGRVLDIRWTNVLAFKSLKLRNARNTRKGLVDESFVLDFGAVPEVDQEPELLAGRFQVVDHLKRVVFPFSRLSRFS